MSFGLTMLLITQGLLVLGTAFLFYSMWAAARDVQRFIRGEALATEVRRPVVSVFKSWTNHLQNGLGLWFATLQKRSQALSASLQVKGLTKDQSKQFQQWLTGTERSKLNDLLETNLRDSFFARQLHLSRWYRLTVMTGIWLLFQLVVFVILAIVHVNVLTEILVGASVIGEFIVMFRSMSVNDSLNFDGSNFDVDSQSKLVLQFDQWPEELKAVYSHVLWDDPLVQNMPQVTSNMISTRVSLLSFLTLKLTEFEGAEDSFHDLLILLRLHLGDGDLLGQMQVLNEFWMESKLDYQDLDPSLEKQIKTALDDLSTALDQSIVQLVAVTISAEENAKQNVLLHADKSKMSSEDLNVYYQRKLDQQQKLHDLESSAGSQDKAKTN